jgi:CO/xanthine dehydrogenase FAD-binding subunit
MRSALSTLALVRPRSLAHALQALNASLGRDRLTPLAGGTDLFVSLNAGQPSGRRFLDLAPLAELRGIHARKDGISIGALTSFREIREHPVVRRRLPSLAAAAAEIGAWQIQARATIGGNIANASPAGDSLPVLLAHEAIVRAESIRGGRTVGFESLFRGYRKLALERDELITSIEIPFPPAGAHPFFRKVGTRRAQSISKVVFCGLLVLAAGGRIGEARLAFGSVAPIPVRARRAERALEGAAPGPAAVAAAREALERDIAPIDDIRSDRAYRMTVAGNLIGQMMRTVPGPAKARR